MKKILPALLTAGLLVTGLSACESAADTANENLSKAAENFEVPRRIVGINGITDQVLFSAEGFCSYETDGGKVDAICLVSRDPNVVERTTMHLSDNVTFVVTQTGGTEVDLFRPRVIFRPEGIVPNFDLSTGSNPTDSSGDN
jgi:tRNA A58 N-methylase Trm61